MNPYKTLVSIALTVLMLSCAMTHSLQRSTPTADIHLPGNGPVETSNGLSRKCEKSR